MARIWQDTFDNIWQDIQEMIWIDQREEFDLAAPTQPTVANLVSEAFKKVGIASPTTAQSDRVTAYHLEELKNDIWTKAGIMGNQRLKSLRSWAVQITTDGKSRYAFPSDFDEEIQVVWLTGTHTGTAQGGAASTITLEDEEDATEAETVGKYILLTGGTGASVPGSVNGFRHIIAYDTDTYIATVDAAWDTNPDATTTYRIIDTFSVLDEDNELEVSPFGNLSFGEGEPSSFTKYHQDGTEYFILDRNPDASTYGIFYSFYKNLMLLDTSGTAYNSILYNWRAPLTLGLAQKIAEDNDDTKRDWYKQEYEKLVSQLLDREIPYGGEHESFIL